MIPKGLLLALFCAAHVQGRPASSPDENLGPDEATVNTLNNEGNTGNVNKNLGPNENDEAIVVRSPSEVDKKVETSQVPTNNNANNIPVRQRAPSSTPVIIADAEPVTEQRGRKQAIAEVADRLGEAIDGVVTESNYSFRKKFGSAYNARWDFGPIYNADAKINSGLSLPHAGAYRNYETNQ